MSLKIIKKKKTYIYICNIISIKTFILQIVITLEVIQNEYLSMILSNGND